MFTYYNFFFFFVGSKGGAAPLTVEQSVVSMVRVIDTATEKQLSGQFIEYDGTTLPW